MKLPLTCRIAGLVGLASLAIAATVPDAPKFKLPAARRAWDGYVHAIERAKTEFDGKVAVARKAYADQLDLAKDAATKSGNLDEALLIRDAQTKLKSETPEPAAAAKGVSAERQALAAQLAGTTWLSGKKTLRFNADGSGQASDAPDPLIWAPLDSRHVSIMFKGGFMIRLDFDEQIKSFAFQEFGHGTRRDQQSGSPVK